MNQVKVYRPCRRAVREALLVDLSPLATAAVVTALVHHRIGWPLWVADGVLVLVSLRCLLSTWSVMGTTYRVTAGDLLVHGRLTRFAVPWQTVIAATLRERQNLHTHDDRLLILKLEDGTVVPVNTSVFEEGDERELIREVQRHVPLTRIVDKPTI